jgi:NTP pyrophosphatase (non-canonical NTP hydrolase)
MVTAANPTAANDNNHLAQAINGFVDFCHGESVANKWWSDADRANPMVVPTKLCLIHSEISEAMEGHRKSLMDDKLTHRKMIEVELADAMIRIGDLAGFLQLDLGGAVVEKQAFNNVRLDHKVGARKAAGGKAY